VSGPSYVIFVNGSYGVGKSSTLDHVGDLLAEAGRAFSLMDVDWFHRSWPPAEDDPENVLTEADNMAAVWKNYLRAGPRQLVVAGVIASDRDRLRYERVFALPVRSVRLVAGVAVTENRLRRRYAEHQTPALAWHLQRHGELTRRLALNNLDELVIDINELDSRSVAKKTIEYFGLLSTPSSRVSYATRERAASLGLDWGR
jgi:hypothetical protein